MWYYIEEINPTKQIGNIGNGGFMNLCFKQCYYKRM